MTSAALEGVHSISISRVPVSVEGILQDGKASERVSVQKFGPPRADLVLGSGAKEMWSQDCCLLGSEVPQIANEIWRAGLEPAQVSLTWTGSGKVDCIMLPASSLWASSLMRPNSSRLKGRLGNSREAVTSLLGSQMAEGHVSCCHQSVILLQNPGTWRQQVMVPHWSEPKSHTAEMLSQN